MNIGTKSVLFGVHQFALHPFFLAVGWWKAFGFRRVQIPYRREVDVWAAAGVPFCVALADAVPPTYTHLLDPRLWLAFVVHDLGYIGKPNMDGPEGETHPEFGARFMRRLFGPDWGDLVLLHSRYYAKRLGRPVSPLCIADKWVIVLEPSWLYLPRVWASGELREFMAVARTRAAAVTSPTDPLTADEIAAFRSGSAWRWHGALKGYMRRWLAAHADGTPDTWTRARHAAPAAEP